MVSTTKEDESFVIIIIGDRSSLSKNKKLIFAGISLTMRFYESLRRESFVLAFFNFCTRTLIVHLHSGQRDLAKWNVIVGQIKNIPDNAII